MAKKKKRGPSKAAIESKERHEEQIKERKRRLRTTSLTLCIGGVATFAFFSWPISLDYETLAFSEEPLAAVIDTTYAAETVDVSESMKFGTMPVEGGNLVSFCEVGGNLYKIDEIDSGEGPQMTVLTGQEGEYYIYSSGEGQEERSSMLIKVEGGEVFSMLEFEGHSYTLDLDEDGALETVVEAGVVNQSYVYEWDTVAGSAERTHINAAINQESVSYNDKGEYFSPTFGGMGFLFDSYTYEDNGLKRHVKLDTGE